MSKRLVIAGTHSGVGKTTITLGLIAAWRRRGLSVQPFKVGPDYIDPTFHTLAAGRPCRNLDTWMMPPERVKALFCQTVADAELAIIEGVMGLYDGLGYEDESGSTAQVAKLLDAPVVVVLDASKVARSAAAVALGYQRFDPTLRLAGFLLNRVAGTRHGAGIASAIEKATGLPVLGWLPRENRLKVPERHLGLVPAMEAGPWQELMEAAGDWVAGNVDLDRLLALAGDRGSIGLLAHDKEDLEDTWDKSSGSAVIAVARDEAFHFTYEENLDLLRSAGATIAFFSPMRDAGLPPGTNGLVLSGGFPEVYAEGLAANASMHRAIREVFAENLPIYAECGGLMYLTQSIVDLVGREHSMVGLLPGRSVMSGRLTLGYRLAEAAGDSWLLGCGEVLRGHEFHYSNWEGRPVELPPAYWVRPASSKGESEARAEGACVGSLWASYVHLHFWGRPELARRFVAASRSWETRESWKILPASQSAQELLEPVSDGSGRP